MSEETIFERILKKEIPAEIVYEDEKVLAFKDIFPQAPIHLLFIHKEKTENISQMGASNPEQASDIIHAISKYTKREGIDKSGYRVVTNVGRDAGQTVFYTHFHVLSGGKLGSFGQ